MKIILRTGLAMLILVVFGVLTGCSDDQTTEGKVTLKMSDTDQKLVLEHTDGTLSDALQKNGQNVAELKQKYQPSIPWNQKIQNTDEVVLQCKCKVNLQISGKKVGTYQTTKSTIGEFLKEKKVSITPWDELKTSPNQKIVDDMDIVIDKIEKKVSKKVEEVPFEKEETKSDKLTKGEKEVKQEGKEGKKVYEVVATFKNGKPLLKNGKPVQSKRLIKEIKPVDQIVVLGTKPKEEEQSEETSSEQEAPSGGRTMMVQATGYTHTGNRTATGTIPKRGTIAVDPSVIPLGTRIYVPGYGYGVAEDTGGVVNGRIIDLFFETRQEAVNWGRRNVQIKILN